MERLLPSRTLAVSIGRPPGEVYAFASDPENLPKWAKGLGNAVRREGGRWIAETAQGPVELRFADRNGFGVMDHRVTLPSGDEVYVPFRVLPNGSGSEVILTLFRRPEVSDREYAEDGRAVGRDLEALKRLLEHGADREPLSPPP